MYIPPQGFRHAAVLLVTRSVRAIPADASRESVAEALVRLAHDLADLADDMRAVPESADWLRAEYARTLALMPHDFDHSAADAAASSILSRVSARQPIVEPRDLFLLHVPEDRLPVAAPLAVELAKRRVSVALSEYEVSTIEQLTWALEHGLGHHRAGAILWTPAFARMRWEMPQTDATRVRVLRHFDLDAAAALADWARRFSLGAVAK